MPTERHNSSLVSGPEGFVFWYLKLNLQHWSSKLSYVTLCLALTSENEVLSYPKECKKLGHMFKSLCGERLEWQVFASVKHSYIFIKWRDSNTLNAPKKNTLPTEMNSETYKTAYSHNQGKLSPNKTSLIFSLLKQLCLLWFVCPEYNQSIHLFYLVCFFSIIIRLMIK